MPITPDQFNEMQRRTAGNFRVKLNAIKADEKAAKLQGVDSGKELELQREIIAECHKRGWLVMWNYFPTKSNRPAGEWDLEIFADGGRLFLIETKCRTGKLSEEQRNVHFHAAKLGHRSFVVRSMPEFLEVVR